MMKKEIVAEEFVLILIDLSKVIWSATTTQLGNPFRVPYKPMTLAGRRRFTFTT